MRGANCARVVMNAAAFGLLDEHCLLGSLREELRYVADAR